MSNKEVEVLLNEIESRKNEYYLVLRNCQANRPNENATEWVDFFFNALINIQEQLMKKLEFKGVERNLIERHGTGPGTNYSLQ